MEPDNWGKTIQKNLNNCNIGQLQSRKKVSCPIRQEGMLLTIKSTRTNHLIAANFLLTHAASASVCQNPAALVLEVPIIKKTHKLTIGAMQWDFGLWIIIIIKLSVTNRWVWLLIMNERKGWAQLVSMPHSCSTGLQCQQHHTTRHLMTGQPLQGHCCCLALQSMG